MPWCPKCKTEFVNGIKVCDDCNTPLVEQKPIPNEVLDDHAVLFTTVNDDVEASNLIALLESNQIPVLKKYKGAGGYMTIVTGFSIYGVEIYVPSKLLEKAQELLNFISTPEN